MKKHLLSSCFVLSIFLVLPIHSYSQRVLLPACNATQPLNQLPWLKAMVDDTIGINGYTITIYEARYKDQIIYRVENIIAWSAGSLPGATDAGRVQVCRGWSALWSPVRAGKSPGSSHRKIDSNIDRILKQISVLDQILLSNFIHLFTR